MAEIAFALGTSHGPLLSTPPEEWDLRADVDRRNVALAYRGGTYSFAELARLRAADRFAAQNAIAVRRERYARCQAHLDELARRAGRAAPDVFVVVGDDQKEWFLSDIQPAFAIYHGSEINNRRLTRDEMAEKIRIGSTYSAKIYHPPDDEIYPCAAELGEAMVRQAIGDGFDVTSCAEQPNDGGRIRRLGHAYGFIYRRLLDSRPIPMVPIPINTYHPPNQPSAARCFAFGQSLGRAIRGWQPDARVAVAASGGVSHFVVDEAFDRRMLAALQQNDRETLCGESETLFRSGTSETKNWIVAAGMLADTGLEMDLLGYVPCYRSEAGTGSGMAFATWG